MDRHFIDLWISVRLSNGEIYDIDAPKLKDIKEMLNEPEYVDRHVTIEKCSIMSDVVVGVY